jgi:hypothetical protein
MFPMSKAPSQHPRGNGWVLAGDAVPRLFDVPADKDIDTQTVVDLRRMLSSAGYGPDVEEAGAKGQAD